MDKSKLAILFGLVLALLFFCSFNVEAAEPSYDFSNVASGTFPDNNINYKFNVGSDGIFINGTNSYVSFSSGTAQFSFDTGALFEKSIRITDYAKYDALFFSINPRITASFSYTDNGFDTFQNSVFTVKPYVVVAGEKFYINKSLFTRLISTPSFPFVDFFYGAEIECIVSFDAQNISSDVIKSFFGSVDINVKVLSNTYSIDGMRYISSGQNFIGNKLDSSNGFLSNILSKFDISLSTFRDNIRTDLSNIKNDLLNWKTVLSSQLTTWKNDLATQLTNWQSALDAKIDELKQALTLDYDASGAESTNTELSGSLDSINTAEGTAMTDAKVDIGNYDTASVFNFAPAVISSLSLITTFSNSFFRASGDLTTALTVLFALVFISAVVGFLRFVK